MLLFWESRKHFYWEICCPMRLRFKVESVGVTSTRIWQSFSFILIFAPPWLFKGLLIIVHWRTPRSPSPGGDVCMGTPLWKQRVGHSNWCWRICITSLRTLFFPVSQLVPIETLISKPVFWKWTPQCEQCWRSRCYFGPPALGQL